MLEKGIITLSSMPLLRLSALGQLACWMMGLSPYLAWLDAGIITLPNVTLWGLSPIRHSAYSTCWK